MRWAVISAENKSFYSDSGIDPMGIARALGNMARGGDTQGGSTITQQFVKNTYLSQEQTLSRKFKEMFISIKVGTKLSKYEILQGYLNTSYYLGCGAYGIQAAAQTYYGKDAEDLTPSECAFLAALLKGHVLRPGRQREHRQLRLAPGLRRAFRGTLGLDPRADARRPAHSAAEYQQAVKRYPMPQGRKATKGMTGQISYLVDTAKRYVLKNSDTSEAQFDQGGYQIYTTFEKSKVEALAKAAVKKVEKENIDPKREKDQHVQFGAATVKPEDGAIVALYGGAGFEHPATSTTTPTPRACPSARRGSPSCSPPPCSTARTRPTVWASRRPASTTATTTPKILNNDGSYVLKKDNTPFFQENESDHPWGYISLRKAMEQSVNTPFVQLGMDVGMRKVAERRQVRHPRGQLRRPEPLVRARHVHAQCDPYGGRVRDLRGVGQAGRPVLGDQRQVPGCGAAQLREAAGQAGDAGERANNVTDVLENVIENGTAQHAKELGAGRPGKTGTTDENKSAWFVGYTQQLSTAVAMFREDPKSHKLLSMNGTAGKDSIHGGDIPTQVWTEFMKVALKGTSDPGFPEAEKIGEVADGVGAPSPTPTETETEEPEPSDTPTPSETVTTPPPPTETRRGPSTSVAGTRRKRTAAWVRRYGATEAPTEAFPRRPTPPRPRTPEAPGQRQRWRSSAGSGN
ncbi:peptidoglycan glycosyltransferase OS=Streptomyces albaduncus OX=68172 GN=FHS32_004464 PE=4 SV=1 [Streptomyces griseoloalbus]